MILRHFPHFGAGALQESRKVAARADTEAYQDQRSKQRQQRLFAGQHHDGGAAKLAERVHRYQSTQILHDLNRPTEAYRADV
ncbi:hypothetical protein D3C81_2070920 [compost metagenome]